MVGGLETRSVKEGMRKSLSLRGRRTGFGHKRKTWVKASVEYATVLKLSASPRRLSTWGDSRAYNFGVICGLCRFVDIDHFIYDVRW